MLLLQHNYFRCEGCHIDEGRQLLQYYCCDDTYAVQV